MKAVKPNGRAAWQRDVKRLLTRSERQIAERERQAAAFHHTAEREKAFRLARLWITRAGHYSNEVKAAAIIEAINELEKLG